LTVIDCSFGRVVSSVSHLVFECSIFQFQNMCLRCACAIEV
jgi:hypothetical protein